MKIRTRSKGYRALREVAQPVKVEDLKGSRIQRFIDRLYKTMRKHKGIGIAANQVGIFQRIIIVGKMVIVNPVIEQDGATVETVEIERCLSLPGIVVSVMRRISVHVTGVDRHGNSLDFVAKGETARCMQHEVDHLNGDLIIDKKEMLIT